MDTDVEVLKPLDDFLKYRAFSGFEDSEYIQTAIMGCEKGFPLFVDFQKYYYSIPFVKEDGSLDTTTNVEILTEILKQRGLVPNNSFQAVDECVLYPSEYFCPKSYSDGTINKTENTYVVHHFDATWFPEEWQEVKKARWEKDYRQRHAL